MRRTFVPIVLTVGSNTKTLAATTDIKSKFITTRRLFDIIIAGGGRPAPLGYRVAGWPVGRDGCAPTMWKSESRGGFRFWCFGF